MSEPKEPCDAESPTRQFCRPVVYRKKRMQTHREKFLADMDSILPWKRLLKPIERNYPKGRRGCPPVGVERMFHIYFMQQWYGLINLAMEENLYDIGALRRFAGVDLSSFPTRLPSARAWADAQRRHHSGRRIILRRVPRRMSPASVVPRRGLRRRATTGASG